MHQGNLSDKFYYQINSVVVKVWKKEEITHACSIRTKRFLFVLQDFTTKRCKNMPSANGDKNTAAHRGSAPAMSGYPYSHWE